MVQVLSGKDRTKRGKVLQVLPDKGKAIVEGINLAKKHQKPRSTQQPGEIIDKNMPLPISKLQLVCPHCSQGTRVGYKIAGEKKSRYCKKCEQIF